MRTFFIFIFSCASLYALEVFVYASIKGGTDNGLVETKFAVLVTNLVYLLKGTLLNMIVIILIGIVVCLIRKYILKKENVFY